MLICTLLYSRFTKDTDCQHLHRLRSLRECNVFSRICLSRHSVYLQGDSSVINYMRPPCPPPMPHGPVKTFSLEDTRISVPCPGPIGKRAVGLRLKCFLVQMYFLYNQILQQNTLLRQIDFIWGTVAADSHQTRVWRVSKGWFTPVIYWAWTIARAFQPK